MTINVNQNDTLFEQANLTPIRGKPTFEMLHKLRNETKANAKSVYSDLRGGAHGHLGLLLNDAQYALIYPTPFVYPTHPGPLIVPDGTTAHANSNMWISHTKELRLFREVTGVEQDLVQQISDTVQEAYLADHKLHKRHYGGKTYAFTRQLRSVDDERALVMQGNCQEKIYNPLDPITTVFSAVKEILEFSGITGESYTQLKAVNTAHIIIHRTGKFGLAICEWNCIPEILKMWVRFKQFFWTSHQELRVMSGLTFEDAGMHHENMVRNFVTGLQDALEQDQVQTETQTVVLAPVDHVTNTAQNTQQQLATQLQKMQETM